MRKRKTKKNKKLYFNIKKGAFTAWCKRKGYTKVTLACIREGLKSRNKKTRARARLALAFRKMAKKRRKKRGKR